MHTSAREEAALPEQTNEPETPKPPPETSEPPTSPEPETGEPETPEQEGTALVPTEPEVIEGEVIELEPQVRPEAYTLPEQKPYWLLIPFAILLCLSFLAVSLVLPLFTPSATITFIPVERSITTTEAIQVPGRQVAPLTLSQSATVPATGKRHQDATRASGTITLYNGLLTSQTIAAGTILTGSDGVHIVTDHPATIPAATPPFEGQVTVSAHAITTGASGNIPAYDLNQACCATSVLAKNTEAFTGGRAARDVLIVTRTDINTAVTSLLVLLRQSENAALQAQLTHGEDVISPPCTPHVSSDHKMGDEANQVSVTVSVTCSGIAYAAHTVYANATQMIPGEAAKRFGTGYSLLGEIQISVIRATITNQARGIATIVVTLDATYVYQLSPGETQQLVKLIAGKTKQQAISMLLTQPGIQGVQISVKGGNQILPQDPGSITIRIQYIAIS